MHPLEFAAKWRQQAPRLTERAAYQEHWRDLCALLDQAVAAAYGWAWPLEEEELLARLLALNLEGAGT